MSRNHFLHVAHDKIRQQALRQWKRVADFGQDHVFDRSVRDDFFELICEVFNDQNRGRATVFKLMLHLTRSVERVGIDDHDTGFECAKEGDRVLKQVRHLNGEAIALFHFQIVLQKRRKRMRLGAKLGEADAVAHVRECGKVFVLLASIVHDLDQAFVSTDVDFVTD